MHLGVPASKKHVELLRNSEQSALHLLLDDCNSACLLGAHGKQQKSDGVFAMLAAPLSPSPVEIVKELLHPQP